MRTQSFGYDLNGNLTGATDDTLNGGAELYSITYDALNRPDVETVKYIPGGNRTLDSDYDRFGNRSGLMVDDIAINTDYSACIRLKLRYKPLSPIGEQLCRRYGMPSSS